MATSEKHERPLDEFWNRLHLEKLAHIGIIGLLVGIFFQDPREIAKTIDTAADNKEQLLEHRKVDAHGGARERLSLIEQRQDFFDRKIAEVLTAIKTNTKEGIKTNRLIQRIAEEKTPLRLRK